MPEITFYVLPTESAQERYHFACKLIEKAYRSGAFAYVLTDSPEQSKIFDDLLWTFRPGSFVPHQMYSKESPDIENVILIGSCQPPLKWLKTIINLSSQVPQHFIDASRILEILDDSEETKARGRESYRHYQQAGITITTHKME